MEKKSSWKTWTLGIALILAGISGCTVTMMRGGDTSEAISQGVDGVKQGVDVIRGAEGAAEASGQAE